MHTDVCLMNIYERWVSSILMVGEKCKEFFKQQIIIINDAKNEVGKF